ncbi:MAG: S8 family serine peptidase [Acidimicrobiaceae bacterium]|nr:S8 family serine peptidase [Acidimicrobiaceae bacterium]
MTPPTQRPAWSRDSMMLRLPSAITLDDLTHEWVFGNADGTGVRVAVIDSGIDADHPSLQGCVDADAAVAFTVDAGGEVVADHAPHGDSFGHGTACAGIIHSLAPAARITSVKVLGAGLSGRAAAFLGGLEWAVEQGFDVVNLSLGSRTREHALGFHELCDRAYFGNTLVVTAANNMNSVSYPSLFASVLSVACNLSSDPFRYHVNPEPPTEFLARNRCAGAVGASRNNRVHRQQLCGAAHCRLGRVGAFEASRPAPLPGQVGALGAGSQRGECGATRGGGSPQQSDECHHSAPRTWRLAPRIGACQQPSTVDAIASLSSGLNELSGWARVSAIT